MIHTGYPSSARTLRPDGVCAQPRCLETQPGPRITLWLFLRQPHRAVPFIATRKAEQNQRAVDPWTAVHLSTGLAMGLMDIPFKWAVTAAVAYEVIEQVFERVPSGQTFFRVSGPEVFENSVVDVVVFAAGHWLGTKWNAS